MTIDNTIQRALFLIEHRKASLQLTRRHRVLHRVSNFAVPTIIILFKAGH